MLRALVVSNMLASEEHPERGSFVRDQVRALRGLPDLSVSLYEFPPGPQALVHAARDLRRRFAGQVWDVVHAHFSLSAWPALAVSARVRGLTVHGSDVSHPRTRQATRAILPLMQVVGAASGPLAAQLPGRRARERAQVLPCGVDLERFRELPRVAARTRLGLEPDRPYLLFAADPSRPEKRYDRALALAGETRLLALGGVAPAAVPDWVNAANAVLVTSEREGFGLAVLEALACNVPVFATPVGIHPTVLENLEGTLCAGFDEPRWSQALASVVQQEDPRVCGRPRAEPYSTHRMAELLVGSWREALSRPY
jgi:glycosyltransferase involved in cell wall biosynthesis